MTPLSNLRGRKVMITGGLGFIGSNLAHACLQCGAEVTIYDCLDPHGGGNLHNVKDIRDAVRLRFHDILDFGQLCEHIADMDMIFNCAASTSHMFSMREPWIDLDVNSKGVLNLLEAIRRFNPSVRFIHLGTTTQLGKLKYQPADEKHPEFPTDIYSANKCAAEKYVLIYARAYGVRATVLRLSNVYGPRASIHSPEFTFNNYFVGLALRNQDITVYGDGKQKRNVIYVDDAVSAMLKVVEHQGLEGETFFAVGDEHFSVAEIAEATMRHMGSGKVRFVPWPKGRAAVDVGDAVISNRKLKDATGWSPTWNLDAGLAATRTYFEPRLQDYLR